MNKKVSELVEVVNIVDDALFYVVDTADLSEDVAGSSKKIKKSSLIKKATTLHSGTVKTDITEADPIVYTKTTVDSLLTSKADLVSGKVPASQLPSYVDDVIEVANFGALPLTGESGKIYVTIDNNKLFRWSGTVYIEISAGVSDHTLLTNIGTNSHAQIDTALTRLANTSGTNTGDQDLSGLATIANLNTKADQDGTILYHSVKWFTPTGTVSNVGATVTSVGTQFLNTMIGAKLTINGESRIITGFTSSTVVTVNSAYSVNNTGVVAGNWGVYRDALSMNNGYFIFKNFNDNPGLFGLVSNGIMFSGAFESTNLFSVKSNGFTRYSANANITFSSNAVETTLGVDTGLRRNTAGVLEIYDGVTATGLLANRRDLLVRNITASAGTNSDHVVIKSQLDAKQDVITNPITGSGTAGYLPKFTGAGAIGNSIIFETAGGLIGIGTTNPSNIISINGNLGRTIGMEPHTVANTAGNNFTLTAGGASVGATDKDGGALILISGLSTGSGTSVIAFNTASAGASGTTYRVPSTKMVILGNGNVGIGTTNPSNILSINGDLGRSIVLERRTGIGQVGNTLSIVAGGSSIGGTNLDGGALQLFSGPATGTGSSNISFFTFSSGASGTTTGTPTVKMVILGNGNVGIGTVTPTSRLQVVGLPSYADNASAITGGLTVGAFYHTAGVLKVVI